MEFFWVCFEKFWCSDMKFIETWNIHDADSNGNPDAHNCTNNELER